MRQQQLLLFFVELQRRRINAVTLPGGLRAIRKNMPEMRTTTGTHNFITLHALGQVSFDTDARRIGSRVKTRPTGTGIKFCIRIE
jgi:hypothetical protein